jgi:2-polyprenyl-6-methoxyphenol hydroxylase-like FAD-dependent oxidoreductase
MVFVVGHFWAASISLRRMLFDSGEIMRPELKVIIAGAGLGGLALAQMLKNASIEVHIFERDSGPWERAQGYRLHIDADGVGGVSAVLPPRLLALFEATAMCALPYTTMVDGNLAIKKRIPIDTYSHTEHHIAAGMATHVNVDRAILREILLTGLDDIVHYGNPVMSYESESSGVTVTLADGQQVRGDVLVGADGIRSAVRQQRSPQARMMDTGVRCLYGRISMTEARRVLPPHAIADVFTFSSDERKVLLGMGGVLFPMEPSGASRSLAPEAVLPYRDDYMACIVAARPEYIGKSDAELRRAASEDLQGLASKLLVGWPHAGREVIAAADSGSFFYVEMYSSIPGDLGQSRNVTLLGDAAHAMSPSLGRGANVALRDAANLGRHLIAVFNKECALAEALHIYEQEMTRYGFEVVRNATRKGEMVIGQTPLPE